MSPPPPPPPPSSEIDFANRARNGGSPITVSPTDCGLIKQSSNLQAVGTKTATTTATGGFGRVSFERMLDKIDTIFSQADNTVDVDELWRVLESYQTDPREWAQYAYYDMQKYKRNLVAEHPKYNVMILTWGPNTRSCIHDHAGSHCFMKVLDGELIESRFAWPEAKQLIGAQSQEMCRLSDNRMATNDVLYINDKVGLHLVANGHARRTAASLHVYIPPYRECKSFDERTGRAVDCKLQFYSKCGRVLRDQEED